MHPHVEAGEAELPEVRVDCGHFNKDHQITMPLRVAKDRCSQMLAGTAVESKGRDSESTSFTFLYWAWVASLH